MKLHELPRRKKRKMPKNRIGRDYTRGGHTVGRGTKGQKSRSGHKSMIMFEGGNVPFYRKVPKYRGFKRTQKVKAQAMNVSILDKYYKAGETVTLESLREKGLIRKRTTAVKILGYGELTKKLIVQGIPLSESAEKKVLTVKGQIKK
ncbi:50S ribosomal protein L15 [Candidatus Dojkabacteria bacterium]|uniref:Large ribosomal subunit protein uL15 n=1 Tax=Candidatus Dojkabacteria bacterium TaxID=2099670 RepID=A0A955HYY7_9BACT|nr:50S ribosomal protein L15 [Candidatus Dojkabacteria bacterium]